ncbi:hypothetical protein GCM10010912_30020 [Paenibacillus albidus]|uniref:Uncharacterized protein n=2 Tax=Paenibacillus albidus TaxID=2041023 RepID=A0A917FJ71_9BACL|nr:hypothetical protein GCM10010912_30020 [Paenibacillus albidus]
MEGALELIELHLKNKRISEFQAKLLRTYVACDGDVRKTASLLESSYDSVYTVLSRLKGSGVLEKGGQNRPYIIRDGSAHEQAERAANRRKPGLLQELIITDQEREWMLKNYPSYKHRRGAAAAAMGCNRWRVCQLAIALKLDKKNA